MKPEFIIGLLLGLLIVAVIIAWRARAELKQAWDDADEAVDAMEEKRIMELAAISTASIQNTAATVVDRIGQTSAYWTAAYGDVCRAVDREMELRARLANAPRVEKKTDGYWLTLRDGKGMVATINVTPRMKDTIVNRVLQAVAETAPESMGELARRLAQ